MYNMAAVDASKDEDSRNGRQDHDCGNDNPRIALMKLLCVHCQVIGPVVRKGI